MKHLIKKTAILLLPCIASLHMLQAKPVNSKINQMKLYQTLTKTFGNINDANKSKTRSSYRLLNDSTSSTNGTSLVLSNIQNYTYLSTYGYDRTYDFVTNTDGEGYVNSIDVLNNNANIKDQYDIKLQMSPLNTNQNKQTVTFNSNHNEIDELNESFNGTVWNNQSKTSKSLNANNLITESIYYDNNFQPLNKEVFVYTNNIASTIYSLDYNSTSSSWDSTLKYILSYSLNNKITQILTYQKNGTTWVYYTKDNFTYTASNKLLNYTDKMWDGTTWVNNFGEDYYYNTNNQITNIDFWDYSGTVSTYKITSKATYTFGNSTDPYPQSVLGKKYNETTSVFDNNSQSSFTYVNNNLIKLYKGQHWNTTTNVWDDNEQTIFTYQSYTQPAAIPTVDKTNDVALKNTIATNELLIESNAKQAYSIYNLLGQKIEESTLTDGLNTISTSNLQNGMYILQTKNGSIKFIKQ